MLGTIPFKGQVLNQLAAFWFEATADLVPNHVINVPDPNVMVARECEPLPVEFVMRAYLTGVTSTSIWTHYEKGGRTFCGHELPDGHEEEPAAAEGDPDAVDQGREGRPRRVGVARGDPRDGRAVAPPTSIAPPRCARACSRSASRRRCAAGLILVDTKYEIGRRPDGTLCFIDEIHTPDSSRYWYADDYEDRFARGEEPRGLDKEYVRRRLADQGYRGDGPAAQAARRRPRRGGAPLHPGLRAGHRPPVRPRHRRAERAHPQEPEARLARRPLSLTLSHIAASRGEGTGER